MSNPEIIQALVSAEAFVADELGVMVRSYSPIANEGEQEEIDDVTDVLNRIGAVLSELRKRFRLVEDRTNG